VLKQGMILPVYVIGYGIGRLMIEAIRIDPAPEYLGLRFNLWVYGVAVLAGIVMMRLFANNEPSFHAATEPASDSEDHAPA
jgi:prolipoprotein diacylglyceryltransferase